MALTQKAVSQQMVPEVTEGVPHTCFFPTRYSFSTSGRWTNSVSRKLHPIPTLRGDMKGLARPPAWGEVM